MANEHVSRRTLLRGVGASVGAAALAGQTSADDGDDEYIVGVDADRGVGAALRAADSVKRELDFGAIGKAVAGRFSEAAIDSLERNPNVRYIEKNGQMHALNQVTPYGIEKVEADVAIDDGYTGDGANIAIIDTGIDVQHETLEENLATDEDLHWAADDAECDAGGGGCMFGGGNDIDECLAPWDDDNDHGSHCAGTAAAADNGDGVLGVAPAATLHAVKVLDRCGSGSWDGVAAGIEWAADQDEIDVLSMSLGGDESDVVSDACDYAANQGKVLVAAAGNDGECTDCVGHPAAHEEVIAVSATDENDELASFSSTGPEVELAAPGVDTLSTIPRDDYDEFSGTSMACPHVSGGAATVIADGTTNREDVRQLLKDTADDIGLDDNEQGAGRLNVADAVNAESDDDGTTEENVSVVTDAATDVGETSATLNGEVTELDGADEADVAFEYGESGGDLSNTADAGTVGSTGSFDETVDGLDSDTEYEFRAVAETTDDSDAGDVLAFTTASGDDDEESTAPVIDQFDVNRRTSGPWSRADVDWAVSDDDGALDSVTTELLAGTDVLDSETSAVSGSSASGEHEVRTRDDPDSVRLTVTDEAGNETSETKDY